MPSGNYGLVSSSSSGGGSSSSGTGSGSSAYSEAEEKQRIIAATSQASIGATGSSGPTVTTGGRTFAVEGSADSRYTADQGRTYSSTVLGAAEAAKREEQRATLAKTAQSNAASEQRSNDYNTFLRLQASGASREEIQPYAQRLASAPIDRYGNMKDPYVRDASGKAWTEPMLEAFADPTQAAALRYAAATGSPRPTVYPRAGPGTDQSQYIEGESVVFLPDTRPQEKLTSVRQAEAARTVATAYSNIAESNKARSDEAYAAAEAKNAAFAAKYPTVGGVYQLKDDAEAYQYAMDKQRLRSETGPLAATVKSEYIAYGTKLRTANRLVETYNSQAPELYAQKAESEWKTKSEAKYEAGKKNVMSFDHARDVLALNMGIGGGAGAYAGGTVAGGPGAFVGGLAGSTGGVIVGTGQLLGEYAQVAAENDVWGVRNFVKPAKDTVFVKPQKEQMAFGFIPVMPDPPQPGQGILKADREGVGINPSLDLLGSTKMKAAIGPHEYFRTPDAAKNYELVGRGDYFAMKSAWGGTTGGLAGAAIAPSVITKAAELSMAKLPKVGPVDFGSYTEAKAGIAPKGSVIDTGPEKGLTIGKELPATTRVITSETRNVNIGDALRRGVNVVKPGTMKYINPKTVTYEVQQGVGPTVSNEGALWRGVTLQNRAGTYVNLNRQGSQVRAGIIEEDATAAIARHQSLTSDKEFFTQAFKTTTTRGSVPLKDNGVMMRQKVTDSDAYGFGWGVKVPAKPATSATMDVSSKNLLEWGMKPATEATPSMIKATNVGIGEGGGIYKLTYESTGATGGTSGGGGINLGGGEASVPSGGGSAAVQSTASLQGAGASTSTMAPTIPKVAPTQMSAGGMSALTAGGQSSALALSTRTAPVFSTSTAIHTGTPRTATKTRVKTREELTPSMGSLGVSLPVTQAITIGRTGTSQLTAPVSSVGMASISPSGTQQLTAPVSATIQQLTPATVTELTPATTEMFTPFGGGGGFGGSPPPPPPPPPPIVGGLNLPLGVFERDQLGGARRSKSPTARYAPSVTASVFGIATTKAQKSSGWTGIEVRPLVIPKKGTIIEHPYGTSSKKEKKSGGGSKGASYINLSPKLGLDFSGLNFGRRKK